MNDHDQKDSVLGDEERNVDLDGLIGDEEGFDFQAERDEASEAEAGASASEEVAAAVQRQLQEQIEWRDRRIHMLEQALKEKETTLHSYIRAHKKAEGEFAAFKERMERDQERTLMRSRIDLVKGLLEVADDLDRTLESAKKTSADGLPELLRGIEMLNNHFFKSLENLGLEKHDPTGEPFDPVSMEAFGLVAVSQPEQDNTVVATFRTGYRLGDEEVRPALVQVGRYS